MNCRPGDLAMVVGKCRILPHMPGLPTAYMPHVLVTVAELVPEQGLDPVWLLEEPVHITVDTHPKLTAHVMVLGLPDSCLRPIRDPGDDAKDELIRPLPKEKVPC